MSHMSILQRVMSIENCLCFESEKVNIESVWNKNYFYYNDRMTKKAGECVRQHCEVDLVFNFMFFYSQFCLTRKSFIIV